MNGSNQIPWPRISAEAAVIIVSILFAFAIDAWWDGVKTDRDTQEILDAVLVEMESNLTGLQDSIAHHVEIVAAIDTAQDQVSVAGLSYEAVIDVEVFEPGTGALDTLIATGMLGGIDNRALQIALGDPIWDTLDGDKFRKDVHTLNLLTMRQVEEKAAIESAHRLEEHLRVLIAQLEPDS